MYVYVCVCVRLWDRQTLTFVVPYARGFAWGPKMYRRRRPVYLPIYSLSHNVERERFVNV